MAVHQRRASGVLYPSVKFSFEGFEGEHRIKPSVKPLAVVCRSFLQFRSEVGRRLGRILAPPVLSGGWDRIEWSCVWSTKHTEIGCLARKHETTCFVLRPCVYARAVDSVPLAPRSPLCPRFLRAFQNPSQESCQTSLSTGTRTIMLKMSTAISTEDIILSASATSYPAAPAQQARKPPLTSPQASIASCRSLVMALLQRFGLLAL